VTVNVTTPLAFDVPDAAEITELPPLSASVTVLPDTGLPLASFKVTVTVEVATPSSRIGDVAVTVEFDAETAPMVKLTMTDPTARLDWLVSKAL
jgi:hypothetical protein